MVQVVEGEAKQVQQARLVYPRETIQRLDVLPFAVAYIGLIASHFVTDGMLSTLSLWSIPVLVDLDSRPFMQFVYQHHKYLCDQESWQAADPTFHLLTFPVDSTVNEYLQATGLTTAELKRAVDRWQDNKLAMPIPLFKELFVEHALAPFFVFQVFSVALWMMDEYWQYSVFTLCMLTGVEAMMVWQRQRSMTMLRRMRKAARPIQCMRNGKWTSVSTDELVPGDLISVRAPSQTELERKPEPPAPVPVPGRPGVVRRPNPFAMNATPQIDYSAVPADVVLLSGGCVVNEAMLTGESVPQVKEGLRGSSWPLDTALAAFTGAQRPHTKHVLFAGTSIITHDAKGLDQSDGAQEDISESVRPLHPRIKCPDNGCPAYVVRTGFYTSQGSLLRTMLFATQRVTAANKEALIFIMGLMVFAIAASAYVLNHTWYDEDRSAYKLALHCILIITSVIPPELPMELSMAVNASLAYLTRKGIFCTEPFRIPLAGKVDVCAFDKTGTLTSDKLVVQGVVLPQDLEQLEANATHHAHLPLRSTMEGGEDCWYVLGGCQELVNVQGKLVGDPLEKAALHSIHWTLSARGVVSPVKGKGAGAGTGLRAAVDKKWSFTSASKRMTTIIRTGTGDLKVVCKGAPEALHGFMRDPPQEYEAAYQHLTLSGHRVLALAYRNITPDERSQPREALESNMHFAGFLVLNSPLKSETAATIDELIHSSHRVIMITGDAAYTAVAVSRSVGLLPDSRCAVLDITPAAAELSTDAQFDPLKQLRWTVLPAAGEPVTNMQHLPFALDSVQTFKENGVGMTLTGAALKRIQLGVSSPVLHGTFPAALRAMISELCGSAQVFARMAPDQKELILQTLNTDGNVCLMCGDGTNDVGALKQAHVGISIISNPQLEKKLDKVKDKHDKRAEERQQQMQARLAEGTRQRDPKVLKSLLAEQLEELQREAHEDPSIVQLGDASTASAFTSRLPSIHCVQEIIRQGRCTLVTTQQMFKILGINSLIMSYMLSAQYLHGVKTGDTQATIGGLSIAALFFAISQSKPREHLSRERPSSSVFHPALVLSLFGQFLIHLVCLIAVERVCAPFHDDHNPDGDFEPNVINSAVFLLSTTMQASSFLINYRGAPFMQSLRENIVMSRIIGITYVVAFVAAFELLDEVQSTLQLVPMPTPVVKYTLIVVMAADSIGAFAWDRVMRLIFGDTSVREPQFK